MKRLTDEEEQQIQEMAKKLDFWAVILLIVVMFGLFLMYMAKGLKY